MDVLLTADRTLMSDYHKNEFVGFGTCAPPNVVPEWFFKALFFPPIKTRNGIPYAAPYGLRKAEAQLINEGFEVLTVDPDHLNRYIEDAKVLGIYVMDPFGLGPASTTLAGILKTGEPYLAKYFHMLFHKPEVQKAKKRGLKILVGGPGTWQFKVRRKFLKEHEIDCIISGEGEKILGKLVRMALNGEELPQFYDVSVKESPSLEEIPEIKAPSINGLIEIGRGCCRGCLFCDVTLRPLRWYPYEKIEKELKVNLAADIKGVVFHAEDVPLYSSKNTIPRTQEILKLHKRCKKLMRYIHWSHASMAAIAADPKLVPQLAEIINNEHQDWWGAEMGIETGSPELLKKEMPVKAHPFKPEEWPEVVKTAAGIMTDNNMFPACTLITGLPRETEDDVIKTIELIDELKDFKSFIVPLFFVPMGRLKNKDWFKEEQLSVVQKELLIKCMEHDKRWVDELIRISFKGKLYSPFIRMGYWFFAKLITYKARNIKVS